MTVPGHDIVNPWKKTRLPAEGHVLERPGRRDGAAQVVAGEIPASGEGRTKNSVTAGDVQFKLAEIDRSDAMRNLHGLEVGHAARTAPWGLVPSGGCGRCACRSTRPEAFP